MGLYEYDERRHIQMERKEAWEDGWEEGRLRGQEEGRLRGQEEGQLKGWKEGQQAEREKSIINIIEISQEFGASLKDTVQSKISTKLTTQIIWCFFYADQYRYFY